MKNDKNEKMNDKLIISKIKKFEIEIQERLKQKTDENSIKIEEYFIINKSWIQKYIQLNQKEELFKDFIYLMLKKISFNPHKYFYQKDTKKYEYYNNIKLIPRDIVQNLLLMNKKNIVILTKTIIIESKIILISHNQDSLEILNEKYYPEYLLYFGENKDINAKKMINIFIKELKLKIPDNLNTNNIIFDFVANDNIIIKIINLKIILNKEQNYIDKLRDDNNDKINKLWEEKYKLKLEKNLDDIDKKLNEKYQNQLNINTKNFNQKIKNQIEEQNKIFSEDYNKSVIKLNNLKEEEDEKKEKLLEKIKKKKEEENIEKKIVNDYFEILEKNGKFDIMKLKDKDQICSFISPILFALSQITSLTQYLTENQETIELYKLVENTTLTDIFFDFLKILKSLDGDKINLPQKGIFKENSNLVFDFLLSKRNENSNIISSQGDFLSEIILNFQNEQDKYFQYISEEENTIELNKKKKYNIYNEQEMLQNFIDSHANESKNFFYNKFHNIIKTSRLCKVCKKCTYNFKSFPTLRISLVKSDSLLGPIHPDYEICNALINRICFPENLSQLLSPSYSSVRKELCEKCKKYTEVNYNNNIFAVKKYLIINIDRENDPKNEMMFIYPEILDLRKQSAVIINLYQLVGVISKKINEKNDDVENILNENAKYICYFKIEKSDKWLVFDENYKLSELKKNEDAFNFRGVSILIYSKIIENEI